MTEENDSEFEALYGIAKANLSLGKNEEAIANFLELGALCEEKDNLVKAYEMYRKVLELNPLNMDALNKVGVIYNKLNPDDSNQEVKKKEKKKKVKKK
ncbi:MAG: hypothetical protein EAX89_03980 [Candidatus Lokiarchaeota archaeon]|nr:hypothetical protein [Candidatus Lokiarchaeota archaeon]